MHCYLQFTRRPTGINVVINDPCALAGIHRGGALRLERGAVYVARRVKYTLECVALPAEDVVAVPSVADADEKKGNQTS